MSILAGSASKFVELVMPPVVGELVSTAFSYLRKRLLPYNTEAELKRLKTALPKITAVMSVAEPLKVNYPNTSEWVEQFTQAIEASKLVLIELEYKNDDEVGESASSSKKRKRCTITDGTLKMLKHAVTLMDKATADINLLLELAKTLGVQGGSESRQYTNKILYINKILRQEIKICVAEIGRFEFTKLLVNLPHLELSYIVYNILRAPNSLTSFPFLESTHCLRLKVGGYSMSSMSALIIECPKWLNPLSEIENFKAIRLMQNNSTLTMAASKFVSLMNRCNISISTADLWKVFLELRSSLEEMDIKVKQVSSKMEETGVLVMQNRPSQISIEPALDWSVLQKLPGIQSSTRMYEFLCRIQEVTNSEVEELMNRERHDVGES